MLYFRTYAPYKFHNLVLFTVPLQALNDLWIVGEGFLRSSLGTLQTLQTNGNQEVRYGSGDNSAIQRGETPYIYEQYRVRPFYQPSSGNAQGTLHKLYNSVVEALNKDNKLPTYILMVPDRDIILQFIHKREVHAIIDQGMAWLAKKIDHAITLRRNALRSSRTGTNHCLGTNDQPTIHQKPCIPILQQSN